MRAWSRENGLIAHRRNIVTDEGPNETKQTVDAPEADGSSRTKAETLLAEGSRSSAEHPDPLIDLGVEEDLDPGTEEDG